MTQGSRPVRRDSVSGMGDLLLRGWTMLAESCADCRVPYMQDPQTGDKLCVNCQQRVTSGQGIAEGEAQALGIVPHEHQPSVPESPQMNWRSRMLEARGEPPASTRPASDLYADRIAEKMVEGWTLTSLVCLRCHTPLIRSRDKALYCVGCELLTVVEEQATSPQAAQSPSAPDPEGQGGPHRGGQKRSQDERSPRLGGDPPPEKKLLVGSKSPDQAEGLEVEKGMMDVEFGDSADVDEGQGCTDVLIVGGGCEMDHRGMNPGGHKVDSEVKGTAMTVALQQTVLQKMAEVGSLVSQTPVTQTEELSKRLDLLKECIGVVKALKDLKI